jgi:hypothetical protein
LNRPLIGLAAVDDVGVGVGVVVVGVVVVGVVVVVGNNAHEEYVNVTRTISHVAPLDAVALEETEPATTVS